MCFYFHDLITNEFVQLYFWAKSNKFRKVDSFMAPSSMMHPYLIMGYIFSDLSKWWEMGFLNILIIFKMGPTLELRVGLSFFIGKIWMIWEKCFWLDMLYFERWKIRPTTWLNCFGIEVKIRFTIDLVDSPLTY